MAQMPKYRCHKEVYGLKIRYVDVGNSGAAVITFEDQKYAQILVDAKYVAKHSPQSGGYYVVYEDGYKSWSPAEAFESGYTLIE